jgi:GT2 family glycosyltransferase
MNWILCPLRNNLHLTRKALPTFLAQDIGEIKVLLFDNASSDGTPQWANSLRDDRVSYVYNVQPLSVAASWNRMLRWTFKQGAEYALVCNNDLELLPSTYRYLVEDGGEFVTCVGVKTRGQFTDSKPDPIMARPNPDFSTFLIRRSCYEKVGPFDEKCEVAFFEDNLYHVAMHRAGIFAHCINYPFLHHGSSTVKYADPKEQKRIREAAQRNREYFHTLHGCYPGTPEYEALFNPIGNSQFAHIIKGIVHE